MLPKARVFIGSSTEGLPAAQAIRSLLSQDAQITMWNEGIFRSGNGYLETLVNSLDQFDFAILVATPDDSTTSRGNLNATPRDNVIFELGLFMGRLGRGRTFLIHPKRHDMRIPSDFSGVVTISSGWPDPDAQGRRNLQGYMSELGAACDEVRDAIVNWSDLAEHDVLTVPGLLRCYTNATDAQAAIGRAVASAKQNILLMATNLSYTPVLSIAEFQQRIQRGVSIRFLVLNPLSEHVGATAHEFLIPASQLRDENKLHLRSLIEIKNYASVLRKTVETAGTVEIRLYDAPPRMRSYLFDWPEGTSFFVPYINRATSRPLPVFECRNSGVVANRYIGAIENLWDADDTLTIEHFIEQNAGFFD